MWKGSRDKKMNIAVVGLGKAGLPLAAVIADSGLKVLGVDIDGERCVLVNRGINPIPEEKGLDALIKEHGGKNLVATPRYEDALQCTVFIVIVPLFIGENNNPELSILESAFRNVGKLLKPRDLVVLETTAPPMTTETLVKKWLEEESGLELRRKNFYLAHSPERIMTGYSISRLKQFPKVIGGVNEESGMKAFETYKKFVPNLHLVSNARTAELIKIFEGCYRDVNIGLANELFKIANELEIDFYEARKYANHEYCHIHLPSTGVGGHCIPIYPWFVITEMEKRERGRTTRLLKTAREVNDEMVEYWAEKIILECLKINKPLKEVRICVKGINFREGVKELYNSRNLALVKLLMKKGLDVYVYDEFFSKEDIKKMSLKPINPPEADFVFDCFTLKIVRSV
jgi:UDP-N-acetyl-D-mannosaminuronic acid dehydrogenase